MKKKICLNKEISVVHEKTSKVFYRDRSEAFRSIVYRMFIVNVKIVKENKKFSLKRKGTLACKIREGERRLEQQQVVKILFQKKKREG